MLLDKFYMFALPVVNIKISIYQQSGGGCEGEPLRHEHLWEQCIVHSICIEYGLFI